MRMPTMPNWWQTQGQYQGPSFNGTSRMMGSGAPGAPGWSPPRGGKPGFGDPMGWAGDQGKLPPMGTGFGGQKPGMSPGWGRPPPPIGGLSGGVDPFYAGMQRVTMQTPTPGATFGSAAQNLSDNIGQFRGQDYNSFNTSPGGFTPNPWALFGMSGPPQQQPSQAPVAGPKPGMSTGFGQMPPQPGGLQGSPRPNSDPYAGMNGSQIFASLFGPRP